MPTTWSSIRHRLENDYLAESLRGHIQYFMTNYPETHDGNQGRIAIRYDGEEILRGNAFWFYQDMPGSKWEAGEKDMVSPHLLVRIMAILDRRVGKRRLRAMEESMREAPDILQRFYALRMAAEGLAPNPRGGE